MILETKYLFNTPPRTDKFNKYMNLTKKLLSLQQET